MAAPTITELTALAAAEDVARKSSALKARLQSEFSSVVSSLRLSSITPLVETIDGMRNFTVDLTALLETLGNGFPSLLMVSQATATSPVAPVPSTQTLADQIAAGDNMDLPGERQSALLAFIRRHLDPDGPAFRLCFKGDSPALTATGTYTPGGHLATPRLFEPYIWEG